MGRDAWPLASGREFRPIAKTFGFMLWGWILDQFCLVGPREGPVRSSPGAPGSAGVSLQRHGPQNEPFGLRRPPKVRKEHAPDYVHSGFP